MAYVECSNGHLYDSDVHASCPYCQGAGNMINFDASGDSSIGKTVPGSGYGPASYAQPGPAAPASDSQIGHTVAPASYRASVKPEKKKEDQKEAESDIGKTVGVMQKHLKIEPVVGWLVCIEGEQKGQDFHIFAKNNSIGRSEKMDVCLKGDLTVSRENHARLGYDEKHNYYHLIPAESTNNIYINDEPVYVPTKLKAYDLIELGETKLVFIPFCSDQFDWKNGLNTGN